MEEHKNVGQRWTFGLEVKMAVQIAAVGFLPLKWETGIEFPTPGFNPGLLSAIVGIWAMNQ